LPIVQREGWPLALAMLDIDHFKQVNDQHGHATGDRVLAAVAQLLREHTRASDVMVRYGGEEFLLVLPGMNPEMAAELCERLRACVAGHAWAEFGIERGVSVSIGLVATARAEADIELRNLVQRADEALYRAKREGRNRVCAAAPL
jgi:diguanylate cyclase (GGDEF)-like protein